MTNDLRYAWRLLRRAPGFSALTILTLTVGIAAATTIFSICDTVLWKPLPYPAPERVVAFGFGAAAIRFDPGGKQIPPAFTSLREFSTLGMYATGGLNVGSETLPSRVRAASVTGGFFSTLGVPAFRGRGLTTADDHGQKVAVVSFSAWRTYFANDPSLIGRQIRLNSQPFTVVGIMPPEFRFPEDTEIWVPPLADPQMTGPFYLPAMIGRLASGVSLGQGRDALARGTPDFRAALGLPAGGSSLATKVAFITPIQAQLTRESRTTLLFLAAIVGLLLAATCANVAGLLLSRLLIREQELRVRAALGAARLRLVRQLLTEAALFVGVSAVLAFGVALASMRVFAAAVPAFAPDVDLSAMDARLFVISIGVVLLTAALFAVGPAVVVSRRSSAGIAQAGAGRGRQLGWFGRGLVVSQVWIALILLAATSASLGTVIALMRRDVGFNNDHAFVFDLTLPSSRYGTGPAVAEFAERLAARLRAIPGVVRVGATSHLPGSNAMTFGVDLLLKESPASAGSADHQYATAFTATPDYFQTMGIPVVAGRSFRPTDRRGTTPVVIISDTAARALTSNPASLLGQHIPVQSMTTSEKADAEIVGIVRALRLRDDGGDVPRQVYRPVSQADVTGSMGVVVESTGWLDDTIASVRQALREIDDDLSMYHVDYVADLKARSLATERLTVTLASVFAAIALVLCACGLYGVLAQHVAQRRREIGVRMALGADRQRVRWMVMTTGLRLACVGLLGGGLTVGLAFRAAARFVPLLGHPSPIMMAANAFVLVTVACLAAWIPARKASSIDPAEALRAD